MKKTILRKKKKQDLTEYVNKVLINYRWFLYNLSTHVAQSDCEE